MIQGIGGNETETIYRCVFFTCVFSYVFIIIIVVLNTTGIIFLRGGICNNNIHIIIPCRCSFSVLVIISGISPYTNLRLCILFSK